MLLWLPLTQWTYIFWIAPIIFQVLYWNGVFTICRKIWNHHKASIYPLWRGVNVTKCPLRNLIYAKITYTPKQSYSHLEPHKAQQKEVKRNGPHNIMSRSTINRKHIIRLLPIMKQLEKRTRIRKQQWRSVGDIAFQESSVPLYLQYLFGSGNSNKYQKAAYRHGLRFLCVAAGLRFVWRFSDASRCDAWPVSLR